MAGLLALIFWITLAGANQLSALLSDLLFSFQHVLEQILLFLHVPVLLREAFIYGIYRLMVLFTSTCLRPVNNLETFISL